MVTGAESVRRALVVAGVVLLGVAVLGSGVSTVVAQSDGQAGTAATTNLTDVYTTGTEDGYREIRDIVETDNGGFLALQVTGIDATETTILGIDSSGSLAGRESIPGRYESIARVDNNSYAAAGTRGEYALLTRIHEEGWVQWTERYGGPNETDVATDVVSAPHGDAYLLASTESVDNTTSDLWVLRVDDEGEVRWDRVVEHDSWTAFPQGERLTDGSLVATIQTERSVGGEVDGQHEVFAARLAPDGTVEWRTNLSDPRDSAGTVAAFDVVPAQGDGVLLAGTSNDSDEPNPDAWAAQLTAEGDVGWQRQYDSDGGAVSQTAVRTGDGYVLAGAAVGAQGVPQGQLLVIDATGDEQLRTTVDRNRTGLSRVQSAAWAGNGRLGVGGFIAVESDAGRQSEAWIALAGDLGGVNRGPSTWETQHSEAERAGTAPAVEDSSLDTVLFAATALSVGLLVLPYGLRRLRRRR